MRTVATANGVDSLSLVDRAKRAAARQCVDENVRSDQVNFIDNWQLVVISNLMCLPILGDWRWHRFDYCVRRRTVGRKVSGGRS